LPPLPGPPSTQPSFSPSRRFPWGRRCEGLAFFAKAGPSYLAEVFSDYEPRVVWTSLPSRWAAVGISCRRQGLETSELFGVSGAWAFCAGLSLSPCGCLFGGVQRPVRPFGPRPVVLCFLWRVGRGCLGLRFGWLCFVALVVWAGVSCLVAVFSTHHLGVAHTPVGTPTCCLAPPHPRSTTGSGPNPGPP